MRDLTDIADEINSAKNFIACVYTACEASYPCDERSAICAVANAAREKLEAVIEALNEVRCRLRAVSQTEIA